jgi:hypothetical protein
MALTKKPGTIAVSPAALTAFANNVLALLGTAVPGTNGYSLSDAQTKLSDISANPPIFGTAGLIPEADTLKSTITSMAGKALSNLQEFSQGMTTVCNDLITFAGQYANADALAKADAEDIWNAIGPDLENYFQGVAAAAPTAGGVSIPAPGAAGTGAGGA